MRAVSSASFSRQRITHSATQRPDFARVRSREAGFVRLPDPYVAAAAAAAIWRLAAEQVNIPYVTLSDVNVVISGIAPLTVTHQ